MFIELAYEKFKPLVDVCYIEVNTEWTDNGINQKVDNFTAVITSLQLNDQFLAIEFSDIAPYPLSSTGTHCRKQYVTAITNSNANLFYRGNQEKIACWDFLSKKMTTFIIKPIATKND